ncbi:hypothetical protein KY349_02695, partial [Candidatus Woesearchaeota archaeon]|nr:hypothetical protein [Candidatus Woesearchaeota archaeon]
MAEFKLVISDPKTGKSVQKEVKDDSAKGLVGKKIKEAFKGELIDMPGYEFEITGGSDSAGFPMRWDVHGPARKQITAVKGIGVTNKLRRPNPKKKGWRKIKGMRLKKTVAGNTVHDKTAQINLKVLKMGRENLFAEKKEEAKAETPAEAPKKEAPKEKAPEKKEGGKKVEEEKKEEAPVEETPAAPAEEAPEAPAEEAPAEEKKEEAPAEEPAEEKKEETEEKIADVEEEIKKDEEEIAEETEKIEKIEEELKEVDKEVEEAEK